MNGEIMNSIIQGKSGRWQQLNNELFVFIDAKNNIILPESLKGQSIDEVDLLQVPKPEVNMEKLQLIQALITGNSAGYSRLNEYLENISHILALGDSYKAEQEQFEKFNTFVHVYCPIDPKMRAFLQKYQMNNQELIDNLGKLIAETGQSLKPEKPKPLFQNPKRENPINVKKFGLYRFPFLQQEKLYIGEVEQYPMIPQVWNFTGTHFKVWVNIKGIPFLVNGYGDDEYSVVNRLLASQIGKMLGLHCEEVLFGYYHDKAVTLTAFTECINLLENQVMEIYLLDELNYIYQSEQKRCFYFLIQNWRVYAKTDRGIKERFPEHFVTPEGSVFLSGHQSAMFLTPQQMPRSLLVPLEITKLNYRAIKDLILRIGTKDLADITFGSLPNELVELHDDHALKMNKPNFAQKKLSFSTNWDSLIESIEEFEMMGVKM
jgi:hypothetical protein